MPKVTQYIAVAGDVLTELTALFTIYQQLEPAGKQFVDNEVAAVKAEFATVKTALDNFASASTLGKISAGVAVLNVLGGIVTFVETTYKNGAQFLGSDWAVVEEHIDNIINIVKTVGTATPASTPAALPGTATAAQPA